MKTLGLIIFATCTGSAFCQDMVTITPDSFVQPISEEVQGFAVGRAAVTVVGETRTVGDVNRPRLWGKGRAGVVRYGTNGVEGGLCISGSVEFGLSNVTVDWGSAADACPAGTWVCSMHDMVSGIYLDCDTDRPDSNNDAQSCDGSSINYSSTSHAGWYADGAWLNPDIPYSLATENETILSSASPCPSYPVWCCSEYQP